MRESASERETVRERTREGRKRGTSQHSRTAGFRHRTIEGNTAFSFHHHCFAYGGLPSRICALRFDVISTFAFTMRPHSQFTISMDVADWFILRQPLYPRSKDAARIDMRPLNICSRTLFTAGTRQLAEAPPKAPKLDANANLLKRESHDLRGSGSSRVDLKPANVTDTKPAADAPTAK